jgi:glutaconate CoA-transferase subunit B
MVMLRQTPRAFVERVDFVSSMGFGHGPGDRERFGLRGAGPQTVVTDIGVLRPDPDSCELELVALQPGATVDQARDATGWKLAVADDIEELPPPTSEELAVLRELQATITAGSGSP